MEYWEKRIEFIAKFVVPTQGEPYRQDAYNQRISARTMSKILEGMGATWSRKFGTVWIVFGPRVPYGCNSISLSRTKYGYTLHLSQYAIEGVRYIQKQVKP